jgi:phytoene synthase
LGDTRSDLDELIARVDPDRWLASRFIGDHAARADVIALYAYDYELGRAAKVASNDLLAEIRLTWWREALDEIYEGGQTRRHPTAEALGAAIRRHSLPRAPLEAMIDGRIEALGQASLDAEAAACWADTVEGSAAVMAAALLDRTAPADAARSAGRAWGLALLQRSGLASPEVVRTPLRRALAQASAEAPKLGVTAFPAALPAALARYDLAGRAPGPFRRRLRLVFAAAAARL